DAELLRLPELRPRALAGDYSRRLARDGLGHLRAELLERGLGFLTGPAVERSRDHVLPARERALDGSLGLAGPHLQPERPELLDEPPVLLVPDPPGNELRPVRTDAFHLFQPGLSGRREPVDRADVLGEVASHDPADLGDVQPEEDAEERLLL